MDSINTIDIKTIRLLFTIRGKWRGDLYGMCMKDLKSAIRDGDDPYRCNTLICMAARLADKISRGEVRGYVKILNQHKLLLSFTDDYILTPHLMDRNDRNMVDLRIGRYLFTHYMPCDRRSPYGAVKNLISSADEQTETSQTDDTAENEDAGGTTTDNDDDVTALSTMTPDKRNTIICLLARFVKNSKPRAHAIGKLSGAMAADGILDIRTINYVQHIGSVQLIQQVMSNIIRNMNNVKTPILLLAFQHGFEFETRNCIGSLTELALRDDLDETGCRLVGRLLAVTGVIVGDKRRTFTLIEIRAMLGQLQSDVRVKRVLAGYTAELTQLAKLAMERISETTALVADATQKKLASAQPVTATRSDSDTSDSSCSDDSDGDSDSD